MNVRWPHEGVLLGFEFIEPDEHNPYKTINIHLLLITLILDYH